MLPALNFLERRSKPVLLAAAVLLILILGLLDYLTGFEISFSIFYLVPTAYIAWLLGRRPGVLMAAVSTLAWLVADLLAGHVYSNASIPYWNAGVRFGFFLSVALALSSLHVSERRREELMHFLVHDLRAPLSNIVTGLQVMQELGHASPDESSGEILDACLVSSNRMFLLINALLDLGRLQNGRMPLKRSLVRLESIVASAMAEVKLWAERNGVSLVVDSSPGAEQFYGDPELTTRVLVNLLGNAIKFSPHGASITIRTERIAKDRIAVSVQDQGSGIPAGSIDQLFTKYSQADLSMGERTVGTGIGLSFIREAVEAQGGRVFLKASSSAGTTITFELPCAEVDS